MRKRHCSQAEPQGFRKLPEMPKQSPFIHHVQGTQVMSPPSWFTLVGGGVSDKEMNKMLSNDDKCTKKVKQCCVKNWLTEESLMEMPAELRHD